MVSFEQARRIIFESVVPLSKEQVSLLDARSRVIASDIIAGEDIPAFDNSSMDGFALLSGDTSNANESAPVVLSVRREVAAGQALSDPVQPKTAVRVMTGAPIPSAADAVIEQELVTARNGSIEIRTAVGQGRNVRRKGEDIRKGDVVVRKGTRLQSAHLGVLGSLGLSKPNVYKKPRVAFLTTGNELVAVDQKPSFGQIRNSNAFTLWGMIQEAGGIPHDLGVAKDNEHDLIETIPQGLLFDVLVTSGGVSVGKYDLVLKVLESLGVDVKFWKVNIKPGMPVAFGLYAQKERSTRSLVFCLPGNPVSTMVTFLQFVKPAIGLLSGTCDPDSTTVLKAKVEHELRKSDSKRHFTRGILGRKGGEFWVRTTGSQSSGVLTSLVAADCLIIVPEDRKEIRAGEEVDIELLR